MSDANADMLKTKTQRSGTKTFALIVSIAWRNLGRNKRRTWLVAGAVAFSVFLTVLFMSLQTGSYAMMTENATAFLTGHLQIQEPGFSDDPRLETTLSGVNNLVHEIRDIENVQEVTPRAQTYVLASVGERSTGVQLMGVVPEQEITLSSLPGFVKDGEYLSIQSGNSSQAVAEREGDLADDAFIGELLARNLGLKVGDELLLMGSQKQGGIAALVVNVKGIFSTGQAEVDRSLIQIPLNVFQEAFALEDEAHVLVVKADKLKFSNALAQQLASNLPSLHVQTWQNLMPELQQAISVDKVSGQFFYGILLVMVIFSVVNTFIMMLFERTREFGVLLSLGMRPWPIVGLLQLEALCLCLLGIAIGLSMAAILVYVLSVVGIPLGDSAQIMQALHLPERVYPAFSLNANLWSPFFMLFFIQIAAFFSSVRVLKMNPVLAMRI